MVWLNGKKKTENSSECSSILNIIARITVAFLPIYENLSSYRTYNLTLKRAENNEPLKE